MDERKTASWSRWRSAKNHLESTHRSNLMRPAVFDDIVVGIVCAECGECHRNPLRRLRDDREFICDNCGSKITFKNELLGAVFRQSRKDTLRFAAGRPSGGRFLYGQTFERPNLRRTNRFFRSCRGPVTASIMMFPVLIPNFPGREGAAPRPILESGMISRLCLRPHTSWRKRT